MQTATAAEKLSAVEELTTLPLREENLHPRIEKQWRKRLRLHLHNLGEPTTGRRTFFVRSFL